MGMSDDLGRGRSSFMVELNDASNIMKAATSRSLVVIDELGYGTSTHDGTAIASAVLQHLATQIKCFVSSNRLPAISCDIDLESFS